MRVATPCSGRACLQRCPATHLPLLAPQLAVSNVSAGVPLDGFMIQLNKNALGLAPADQHIALAPVLPGATALAQVAMVQSSDAAAPQQGSLLQVAIKCSQLGVLYVNVTIPQQLLTPVPAAGQAFFL